MGIESIQASAKGVTALVKPGPEVTRATPGLRSTGHSPEPMCRAGFMPDQHAADAALPEQFFVDRHYGPAGVPEDRINPQHFQDDRGAGILLRGAHAYSFSRKCERG